MSLNQVTFAVEAVEDYFEVQNVIVPECDRAQECYTVMVNRPIRITLGMRTDGATFSDYRLQYKATHADGSDILLTKGQPVVGQRVTRPFQLSDNGKTLVAPLCLYPLFSQTQKRPITVSFFLERDGVAVSEWVSTPLFKVVSKPPTSVRGPAPKRRKSNEGESVDDADTGVDDTSDISGEKYAAILQELKQIKAMVSTVKPEPEAFTAGDSRPLKRKSEAPSGTELAKSIGTLSHESMQAMLRELSANYPDTFSTMMLTGTAFQVTGMDSNFSAMDDAFGHF